MTTWFTSDLHIGHRRIAELSGRPFDATDEGVAEMGEAIVHVWNGTVAPDDTVIVVGDFAMGRITHSLEYVARMNGHKQLISGNHDRCWGGSEQSHRHEEWVRTYAEAGFESVADSAVWVSPDGTVSVPICHFPWTGESFDGRPDRYVEHRPVDDGGWLIHGHVHESWRQWGRQINVGIDAWGGRMVAESEIFDMITAGPRDLARIPWGDPWG